MSTCGEAHTHPWWSHHHDQGSHVKKVVCWSQQQQTQWCHLPLCKVHPSSRQWAWEWSQQPQNTCHRNNDIHTHTHAHTTQWLTKVGTAHSQTLLPASLPALARNHPLALEHCELAHKHGKRKDALLVLPLSRSRVDHTSVPERRPINTIPQRANLHFPNRHPSLAWMLPFKPRFSSMPACSVLWP